MDQSPSPAVAPIAVFDIGNVLIDWDPRHLYAQLFPGRPAAMDWFLDHVCTAAWNLEQDAGRRWAEGVGTLVAQWPEWRAEIEAYDRRWHEMIPGIIAGSVALLDALRRSNTRLFAITNYSSEKFAESARRFPFFAWFEAVVVSADEGLLKPHAPIFELLLRRCDLRAADCVFIDDRADNVAGARAAGMRAILFTTPDALRTSLVDHGFRLEPAGT